MPLCTLEVPRGIYDSLSTYHRRMPVDTCERVLDAALPNLGVPLDDQEYRVITREDIDSSRLILSYTTGADEYDEGAIFNPSRNQIRKTGTAIMHSLRSSPLKIRTVRLDAWKNTAFRESPAGASVSNIEIPPDIEPVTLTYAQLTLALSPEYSRDLVDRSHMQLFIAQAVLSVANTVL